MSDITKHLGQKSDYKTDYDPSLLVREPRQSNRTYLGIQDESLPFEGFDVWNGWEVSGLTNGGIPVSLIAKVKYSASSKYIVESKSIKLYFNSFNMTKLGINVEEVKNTIIFRATKDLSELLETSVQVNCWTNDEYIRDMDSHHYNPFQEYDVSGITLEEVVDISALNTTSYTEDPSILEVIEVDSGFYRAHSAALMSRCKVTNQPDTGDIFIAVNTNGKIVTQESLLKYIVSFRGENHFHEEICEAVFKRLYDLLEPESLVVACLYSRRGGWDINPVRFTPDLAATFCTENCPLSDISTMHSKLPRQ